MRAVIRLTHRLPQVDRRTHPKSSCQPSFFGLVPSSPPRPHCAPMAREPHRSSEILDAVALLVVDMQDTFLNVQGMPLAVDEACSGLNALQAMLVAGSVLALTVLPGWRFWLGMALLPLLAWLANLMRIMTIGITGLSFGPDAAMGWFHTWGGWAVLMLMFGLCSAVFNLMARGAQMRRPA